LTEHDRVAFAQHVMLRLCVIYGFEATEERQAAKLEAYFEALEPYAINEVIAAVRSLITSAVHFPRPAEIIEEIRRRRRAVVSERPALPDGPVVSQEEAEQVQRLMDELRAKLQSVPEAAARIEWPRPELEPLSPEEEARWAAKKQAELERFEAWQQGRGLR
jgi:LmbE family N-acetylglucosaminyl deacetylase